MDTYELKFKECWEESLFLTEDEMKEWLDELKTVVNDDSKPIQFRLQKVIESVTC